MLTCILSPEGFWLKSSPPEVILSDLLPQRRSFPCFCPCRGHWPGPGPVKISGSGQLSHRGCLLRPTPIQVVDLGLVTLRSLAQVYSLGGHALVPDPAVIPCSKISLSLLSLSLHPLTHLSLSLMFLSLIPSPPQLSYPQFTQDISPISAL